MDALNLSQNDGVKLKSCPFCGGEAEKVDCSGGVAFITCMECHAEGPLGQYGQALDRWNRRHDETPSEFERLCGKENSHV